MTRENMKSEVDLKFEDWTEQIRDDLGKGQWITAYSSNETEFESATFYSALIPNERIGESLQEASWDLSIGHGFPGFVSYFKDGKEITEYYRFSHSGVEPLVFWRSFYGIKEGYHEVLEEFRHYFNLFEDRRNGKFIAIDENGDEDDVILMKAKEIKIKLRYVKEFLSLKDMHLAIFFSFDRFSEKTIEDLGIEDYVERIHGDNYVYSIGARKWDDFTGYRKSHAWLMGKKLIVGTTSFKPRVPFDDTEKQYIEFIIDIDEDGKEILHTCNKDELSEWGKNPGSPPHITPVFFRKEVLSKYYSRPSKYSVGDGHLYCANLWGLKMDNNHPEYVIVFLGDLGELPYKEQLHWKSFNIAHRGGISHTAYARGIEGKWTDPERSNLFFKQKFPYFQEKWHKRFGWYLFIPLKKEDEHFFKSLRIPLTNEQKEFDEQVLALTKILIDSLNERELARGLEIDKENPGGIDKLEAFLESRHIRFEGMIEFLRKLQALRSSGSAHRKGDRYRKIAEEFSIGEKEFPEIFDGILEDSIKTLNSLDHRFLRE